MSYSTQGRPRALTLDQIDEVLDWARQRMTAKAKARSLGISVATLRNVLRSGGAHYKSAPPELRVQARAARRRERAALEARGEVF